jgi:thiamine biosynthesis lipoprotein
MRRVLLPRNISEEPPLDGSAVLDLQGETMGTSWSVRLASRNLEAFGHLQSGIQRQLDQVVSEMSHWLPDSDLGRFNRSHGGSWHRLPAAFFEVLSYALTVAEDSGGAYVPTAGALVNLWGFGPGSQYRDPDFQAPVPDQVAIARQRSKWRRIELDSSGRKALQPGGVLIDLSAVAKGYAVDQVARYLEQQGYQHYLVEVGGELRGAGMKPDRQPWWVSLEEPDGAADEGGGGIAIALHGLAVATSGDYRRAFQRGDIRYSHTIDPRTGYPIHNGVASVTVLHASCMAADALSTALTVLGVEEGLPYAERRGIAARFLTRSGPSFTEHLTSRFQDMLQ